MTIVLLNPSSMEYWVSASVCRKTSLTQSVRSAGESSPSVIHRKPFNVLMPPVPICPVWVSVDAAEGGRLVLMRRVKILTEECVITVYAPGAFHSPGSHGYAVSSDGINSYTVRPTTVLWLSSPKVVRMVSSFEKRAPNSFSHVFLSRSFVCQRFLKICLLVVSSKN